MEVVANNYMPGDPRLVEQLVYELKSQGIFDQFRKECIADVDTKPAYQNLRQRVEGSVTSFLKQQTWKPDMNKNQVREQLRKNIYESGYLDTGVERIVDQVVNPKINTIFLPQVEDVVYRYLGLEKPNRLEVKKELKIDVTDLLPTDLEAISPESDHTKDDSLTFNDSINSESKMDEDESPPFEPIDAQNSNLQQEENSVDSHLSGFSGLQSHDSNPLPESKVCQMELSNQDSQVSQNSSESRLSIITSEDNTKMEIREDSDSKLLKSSDSNSQIECYSSKLQITSDLNSVMKDEIMGCVDEVDSNSDNNQVNMKIQEDENGIDKVNDVKEKQFAEKPIEEKKINDFKEKQFAEKPTEDKKYSDRKSDDKKSRNSDKYGSKEKKDDKYRKSSSSSRDKDKSSSKYSSSSSSKEKIRSKDKKESKSSSSSNKEKDKNEREKNERDKLKSEKERDKDKTEREKDKDKKDKSDKLDKSKSLREKEKSTKDKERGKTSSTSSSSNTNKHSTSKEKDKSLKPDSKKDKDKPHSSNSSSSKDSKSKSNHSESKSKSSSDKHKKDEKNSSHTKHSSSSSSSKKEKDKKKASKTKDDHYSSKDKKNDRRSTDRDSNDGRSGRQAQISSLGESNSSQPQKSSQESSNSNSGSGSGDSGTSDQNEPTIKSPIKLVESTELPVPNIDIQKLKYMKPKFASNFQEARKLMKIRKQLAKLERHHQLSLAQIEMSTEIPVVNGTNCEEDGVDVTMDKNIENKDLHEDVILVTSESQIPPENSSVPLQSRELSQENWEALEARLAQEMSNINYNSYESPYDDYDYNSGCNSISSSPKKSSSSASERCIVEEKTEKIDIDVDKEGNAEYIIETSVISHVVEETKVEEEEDTFTEKIEATLDSPKSATVEDNTTTISTEETINHDVVENQTLDNESEDIDMVKNNELEKEDSKTIPVDEDKRKNVDPPHNVDSDSCEPCVYLEPLSPSLDKNLQFLCRYIEKLEQDVKHSLKTFENNFVPLKQRYGKRKMTENVDLKNNNKTHYEQTIDMKKRRRSVAPNPNSVISKANKEKLCNSSDISPNDSFSLPLSPAESDKSNEKRDEESPKVKQKRQSIGRGLNSRSQRYSSEDLYKPRPVFISSRRSRSAKNAEK